jgi:hypothetical protein
MIALRRVHSTGLVALPLGLGREASRTGGQAGRQLARSSPGNPDSLDPTWCQVQCQKMHSGQQSECDGVCRALMTTKPPSSLSAQDAGISVLVGAGHVTGRTRTPALYGLPWVWRQEPSKYRFPTCFAQPPGIIQTEPLDIKHSMRTRRRPRSPGMEHDRRKRDQDRRIRTVAQIQGDRH